MAVTINEDKLFRQIKYFFDNPSGIFTELAQNAQRAGATKLDITLDNNILTAIDNGTGIETHKPLLALADSLWGKEIEENQNPAGWGLFFLYSISQKVTFRSKFGGITINCDEFLSNKHYRESLFNDANNAIVDKTQSFNGFYLEAKLKSDILKSANSILYPPVESLAYFPMDITFNNKPVKKRSVAEECIGYPIKTVYEGNSVFIDPTGIYWGTDFAAQTKLIWYGIPINNGYLSSIVIDVTNGSPLTPVLPYRKAIRDDEKAKRFYSFIRDKIAKYCTEKINSKSETNKYTLEKLMNIMAKIGTQEELDQLDRFYVETTEPFFTKDHLIDVSWKIVHKTDKNGSVVSETISAAYLLAKGKKKEEIDLETLILPKNAIVSIKLPVRYPAWLEKKIREKKYTIKIKYDPDAAYQQSFSWHKATIKAGGKQIKIAAIADGWDCDIFYTKSPADVWGMSEALFKRGFYYEDGDSYDTQEYYFKQDLRDDLSVLTGEYSLSEVFEALSKKTKVLPQDIRSIEINQKTLNIYLKDGNTKTIAVTA